MRGLGLVALLFLTACGSSTVSNQKHPCTSDQDCKVFCTGMCGNTIPVASCYTPAPDAGMICYCCAGGG
jgi:hypothetical protein